MRSFTIRERTGLAAVVLALAVLSLGGWAYRQQAGAQTAPSLMQITPPETSTEVLAHGRDADSGAKVTEKESERGPGEKIVVYVSGAVKRPGVYTLRSGDRVYQAVRAADGFKENAVQEALNLADPLRDGDQIYVPPKGRRPTAVTPPPLRSAQENTAVPSRPSNPAGRRGRVVGAPPPTAPPPVAAPAPVEMPPVEAPSSAPRADKLRNPGDGTVAINTADAAELQRLPGVGPAMAARILAYRQEVGGFKSPEQLMDVKGIGEKKFADLQPFVTVD